MPASRTSRQPLHSQHASKCADAEVIVLSSDDDAAPPPRRRASASKRTSRSRGKTRARTSPVVETVDVFEISSEEDNATRRRGKSSRSTIAALEKKVEQLQRENDQWRARSKSRGASATPVLAHRPLRAHDEKTFLRIKDSEAAAVASKKKLLGDLEEHITCEICELKMWKPYVLSCGHSFCQDCLQEWFSTILAKHMAAHPEYNPHPPAMQQYVQYLRQPHIPLPQRRALERQLQNFYDMMDNPCYTCPTCRVSVKTPPIEMFAFKRVVRTIAQAEGEASPKRATPATAARRPESLWDGFFPRPLI